ncbi:hypothetical protein P378_07745 [Desulforamulus profundi]|uniref:Uncharacterized protein n=1 Tax=Desulforamulus profundi TaxID=1383067 RepID=A0A2C6MGD0_9FIRM|nr:hypothetical protein [Desulforamulus profundi]PHJ38755.1 hypothetical protein P378_07745 [Desulforamulus profundi]
MVKYDGSFNFKAFGKTVFIGGSAAIGTIGFGLSGGLSGGSFYVGAGLLGGGLSVDVKV